MPTTENSLINRKLRRTRTMWKVAIYVIAVIWCIVSFSKAWMVYKNEKGAVNLLEVLARILMIPAGIVLSAAEFID